MWCMFRCYSDCTLKSTIYSFTAVLILHTSLRTILIMTSVLSSDAYTIIEFVEFKITTFFFFLRNSNYEFRVSFTIGVLCQTTNVTLMTSVCGIQHKCGSTVLIIPSSPVYNTSISNTWNSVCLLVCFLWRCGPMRTMASSFLRFLDHTQRRTTVGRTPLDEWSAHRRDLYLTTHNTHNRQISMSPVGFEPTISAVERPQTNILHRAETVTGIYFSSLTKINKQLNQEID